MSSLWGRPRHPISKHGVNDPVEIWEFMDARLRCCPQVLPCDREEQDLLETLDLELYRVEKSCLDLDFTILASKILIDNDSYLKTI